MQWLSVQHSRLALCRLPRCDDWVCGSTIAPFNEAPIEILASQSFRTFGDATTPRLHVEVQGCRYYDGTYTVSLPDGSHKNLPARGSPGDLLTAAGDWIVDDNHAPGWTEIHEARAIAVTRPVVPDKSTSYASLSYFYGQDTSQQDEITIDIAVPRPTDPTLNKLHCEIAADAVQSPDCHISAEQIVSVQAIDSPSLSEPFCRFTAQAGNGTGLIEFGCQRKCTGVDFDEFQQENGCSGVYSTAIRATWTDPGDLWLCRSCSCDDPSVSGALIAAPVQGCAEAGLDPNSATDRAKACAEVCGDLICGAAAPACEIGSCAAGAPGDDAQLVVRNACDPTLPQAAMRVAEAGNYRATLSPESTVTVHALGSSATKSASGVFYFNRQGSQIDFADAFLSPEDFSISGKTITDARVVIAERLFGNFTSSTDFTIPAGVGVFGVRGLLGGKPKGFNVSNPEALTGTVDVTSRAFTLHIEATDPEDTSHSMTADLVGTIDNVPPVADAGGPTQVVECTSPTLSTATLDGSGSFDVDPGDSISHYQWFTSADQGIANTAQADVHLPFGQSDFVLHVYDQKLGASATPLAVQVVDTTPPDLTLEPSSLCLWPPNHRRVRFGLGSDIIASATDACDTASTIKIVGVTSNEPDNLLGDGDTVGDTSFADRAFCVRRERSGLGVGRTYTVTVEARDFSGNASQKEVIVTVPHDRPQHCRSAGTEIDDTAPCR